MKRLFGQYVSKDVYDQLVANPDLARLGGQRRQMTVLFSDIRGFTTVSEKGQPEEIVAILNEYFTRMVEIVFAHKGTLDKFVGDMVMALFGAPLDDPNHAEHAVDAALEMIRELNRLNEKWTAEGRPALDIGIGINTGPMIAGNIGSEAIMSYTVIGDAVNLGARLESLNKEYGTRIIISEATRDAATGPIHLPPARRRRREGQDEAGGDFRGQGETRHETAMAASAGSLSRSLPSLSALRPTRSSAASRSKAQQAQERKQQFDDLNITEAEEIELGADVSLKIRQRFGVVQDPAVHKYVTLVGTMLAEQTTRPKLPWTFIVLDTDGVNAFAAPGGFVHITRGALGADQDRSRAGRRARARDRARRAEAHRQRDSKEQGRPDRHRRDLVGSRRVPRRAGQPRVRHGARELLRSRRRARRRQRRHPARAEGRLRGHRPVGISDAARRAQQGSGGEERPVRVASRKRRSASARSSSSPVRSRARSSQPVTPRRSSTSPPTSRRSPSSSKARRE